MLSTIFSDRAVREAGLYMLAHIDRWIEILLDGIEDGSWSEPKNMSEHVDNLVFDIIGDLTFGKSFELKERGRNEFRDIPRVIGEYVKFQYKVRTSFPNQLIQLYSTNTSSRSPKPPS